jgi:hypothetical protein
MRVLRFLAGAAAMLIFFGLIAIVIFIPKSPSASTAPSRTAFLRETPWPDNKQLGPETFEVLIDLINKTRYYCPQMVSSGAKAMGIGKFGRQIYVWCTTGAFQINIRLDSDQYSVGPLY